MTKDIKQTQIKKSDWVTCEAERGKNIREVVLYRNNLIIQTEEFIIDINDKNVKKYQIRVL